MTKKIANCAHSALPPTTTTHTHLPWAARWTPSSPRCRGCWCGWGQQSCGQPWPRSHSACWSPLWPGPQLTATCWTTCCNMHAEHPTLQLAASKDHWPGHRMDSTLSTTQGSHAVILSSFYISEDQYWYVKCGRIQSLRHWYSCLSCFINSWEVNPAQVLSEILHMQLVPLNVCVCAHMHIVCVRAYVCVCEHARVCTCMRTCMCVCMHASVCAWVLQTSLLGKVQLLTHPIFSVCLSPLSMCLSFSLVTICCIALHNSTGIFK